MVTKQIQPGERQKNLPRTSGGYLLPSVLQANVQVIGSANMQTSWSGGHAKPQSYAEILTSARAPGSPPQSHPTRMDMSALQGAPQLPSSWRFD